MKKDSRNKKTRIMVFGTFDGVHPGHLNFFEQARNLTQNPFLIVSVARGKNVKRIKGKKPIFTEKERLILVKKSELSDKTILGGQTNYLAHIKKEKPDIIALGYDQKEYVAELKKDLPKEGLKVKIVRLKPYKEHIYKNHLLKNKRI